MQNKPLSHWIRRSLSALSAGLMLVNCGGPIRHVSAPLPGLRAPLKPALQSASRQIKRFSQDRAVPGQLIVKFRSQSSALLQGFAQHYRVKVVKTSPMGSVLIQHQPGANTAQLAQRLRQDPAVEYVENNTLYRTHFTVNDPRSPEQKGIALAGLAKAWDVTMGDPRVVIAIIDSGVDLEHPDLKPSLVPGYNVLEPGQPPKDENGHGTHAAGIAAAVADNKIGIAGTAPRCKIMPVRALDAEGSGNAMEVSLGVIWAVDHGAQVINMSLGGPDTNETIERAIKYALMHDVSVVVAAGNETTKEPRYPAALPGVISIGAVDLTRQLADYSNFGNWITLVAPGSQIISTMPTYDVFMTNFEGKQKNYDYLDGTSMAAPIVAGVVALMKSRHPQLRPHEIKARLEATAQDLGPRGFDETYGYGLVNAAKAIL